MGMVYCAKGDFYNRDLYEYQKALEIRLNVFGRNLPARILRPGHPNTVTSHDRLGVVYEAKGDYESAEFERIHELRFRF